VHCAHVYVTYVYVYNEYEYDSYIYTANFVDIFMENKTFHSVAHETEKYFPLQNYY
jgi:hypothetical protein